MPVPMHIDTMPSFLSVRRSSCSAVATMRAPMNASMAVGMRKIQPLVAPVPCFLSLPLPLPLPLSLPFPSKHCEGKANTKRTGHAKRVAEGDGTTEGVELGCRDAELLHTVPVGIHGTKKNVNAERNATFLTATTVRVQNDTLAVAHNIIIIVVRNSRCLACESLVDLEHVNVVDGKIALTEHSRDRLRGPNAHLVGLDSHAFEGAEGAKDRVSEQWHVTTKKQMDVSIE